MAEITLIIKPTAGDATKEVQCAPEATLADLKEQVSTAYEVPAAQLRLIYKGEGVGRARAPGACHVEQEPERARHPCRSQGKC